MSIHGFVNPLPQANSPTVPNSSNITLSDQESSLAKTILEGNKSLLSSSLTTKKVDQEEVGTIVESTNDYKALYLRVKKTKKNLEAAKTQISSYIQKIGEKPSNLKVEMNFRFRLVNHLLVKSAFCSESARILCLEDVRDQLKYMQQVAYFDSSTQMAIYLLRAVDGINCLDMNVVRDALLNLRRANILSSNGPGAEEIKEAVAFFEARWKELKDVGQLDEETYNLLNQNLKQILAGDPFKDEFIKNPELFKQVKNAPEALLKKYPHLASVSDFLSRYPEAGTIQLLDNLLTVSNLKHCINQVKTSPLPRLLLLVSPESLLTPVHAQMLKDLLIEKQSLGIAFGNKDDATALTDAFLKDSSLILDEKSLIGVPKYLDNCGEIFFFKINPEYPVKKKLEFAPIILQGNKSNCSTSTGHTNATTSDKVNLLPKTILEGKQSALSPSLTTKKVEKEEVEITNEYKSPYLSVKRTNKNFEIVKIQINSYLQKLEEKPLDLKVEMGLRSRLVNHILVRSIFCSDQGRQTCLNDARNQINYMQKGAYFNSSTQMAIYLLRVVDGISCLDMNAIREALLNLRRVNVLSSNKSGVDELNGAVKFFETRWKTLKDEGQLDEETYNLLNQNLKQILAEDPFKDEFIKNPELFKQVKNAPEELLKKYPHLVSVREFIGKYPRAGWIELPNQTFNTENLKLCINKAKTSSLATTLLLPSEDPIITPSHALLIKDLLVEKQNLKVAFGNEDDLCTLTQAFYEDLTLVFDKMTTFAKADYSIDDGSKVVVMSLESPIRKAQPLEFRSTKTKGVTLQFELKSNKIFLSLIGYVLVKGKDPIPVFASNDDIRYITVKACDSEAIAKLNRKYIDKYGQEEQYSINITPEELYKQFEKTIEEDRQKGAFK